MAKILRLLDWDTRDVLAQRTRTPVTENFPLDVDWELVFKELKPKDGFQWNLLYDSCDTPRDVPQKEGDDEVYIGYAKAVDLREYWTQHDDSGRHIDGIRELKDGEGKLTGWKIYDPVSDERRRKAQEYANALAVSPAFYYIKDTGSCQRPNQERVYRIFVDPSDSTKLSLSYWGNLASTPDVIYTRILLLDAIDRWHLGELTVQNGRIVVSGKEFYLTVGDFVKCFEPLFVIPLDAPSQTPELAAKTNNSILDAFRLVGAVDKVQKMRDSARGKRTYMTLDALRHGFAKNLVRPIELDFTFEQIVETYSGIVQGLAEAIKSAENFESASERVSASRIGEFLSALQDWELNLLSFTLEEVVDRLNRLIAALNNLMRGQSDA